MNPKIAETLMEGEFCEFVDSRARRRVASLWLWFCEMLHWIVTWYGHSCPYWTIEVGTECRGNRNSVDERT